MGHFQIHLLLLPAGFSEVPLRVNLCPGVTSGGPGCQEMLELLVSSWALLE